MSIDYGDWIHKRVELLKNWRQIAKLVAKIAKQVDPYCEVYVFGSVVEGRTTPVSDVDIMIVTREINVEKIYREVALRLWDTLGDASHIVDLHVIHTSHRDKQPYVWWLRRAVKIDID